MNRNIAFYIASGKGFSLNNLTRAKKNFISLGETHNYKYEEICFGLFVVGIIFDGGLIVERSADSLSFCIGQLGDSGLTNDRFLRVKIFFDSVEIENDYAGSIPVFYSTFSGVSLSNIEPFIVEANGYSNDDISYENIYGFLRYSHFIWDETAFKGMYVMEPDSRYFFDSISLSVEKNYLKSIKASRDLEGLSDFEVAHELDKLNEDLVNNALENYSQIILPLSSGYDSRMILAAVSKRKDLKERLHCFTYGSIGSIEVESARRLTKQLGVKWDFLELPRRFLTKSYLDEIHDIFGCSLHMHGMYQLEFFDEVSRKIKIQSNACLTSGFMTGVPAGQHISLLDIKDDSALSHNMNCFSQSKLWGEKDLAAIKVFRGKAYPDKINERFAFAFNRFDGEIYKKSVLLDIWTRQRSFVSYYPRTLEWRIPVVSPHMNPKYANFFMSISKSHLNNRKAVELMFFYFYPEMAKIASNSNGIKSISSIAENIMFFYSKVAKKLGLDWLIPSRYANRAFEFDLSALQYSKENAVFPLLSLNKRDGDFINQIVSKDELLSIYENAYAGDSCSYEKLIGLQAIALSLRKSGD